MWHKTIAAGSYSPNLLFIGGRVLSKLQNLQQVREIGYEFPIRRDTDFGSVACLIALSEAERVRRETARLKQSFSDRMKRFDPKSDVFARMTEELSRKLRQITSFNRNHTRNEWFLASKEYGYICRERGDLKEPALRHPMFWLHVKRLISEGEWRRMWSSGRVQPEVLNTIRKLLAEDPEREDQLMGTVDFAVFDRRRTAYDEKAAPKTGNRFRKKRRGRGRPRDKRR